MLTLCYASDGLDLYISIILGYTNLTVLVPAISCIRILLLKIISNIVYLINNY